MSQIVANTGATAENTRRMLDMRRMVFGGGALGDIGATPVELHDIGRRARASRAVEVKLSGGSALDTAFSTLVTDLVTQTIQELSARRLLPGMP